MSRCSYDSQFTHAERGFLFLFSPANRLTARRRQHCVPPANRLVSPLISELSPGEAFSPDCSGGLHARFSVLCTVPSGGPRSVLLTSPLTGCTHHENSGRRSCARLRCHDIYSGLNSRRHLPLAPCSRATSDTNGLAAPPLTAITSSALRYPVFDFRSIGYCWGGGSSPLASHHLPFSPTSSLALAPICIYKRTEGFNAQCYNSSPLRVITCLCSKRRGGVARRLPW